MALYVATFCSRFSLEILIELSVRIVNHPPAIMRLLCSVKKMAKGISVPKAISYCAVFIIWKS